MTITTTAATEAATQFPSSFRDCERIIVQELADVLDHMDETQIDALVNLIANARKVFFVGVGRVDSHWKPSPNVSPTSAWTR